MRSTARRSQQAARTMARPACGRTTIPITTLHLRSIPMVTTSRQCVTYRLEAEDWRPGSSAHPDLGSIGVRAPALELFHPNRRHDHSWEYELHLTTRTRVIR